MNPEPVAVFTPGGGVMITLPEMIEAQEDTADEREDDPGNPG
jgi:hypothetical protein